MIATKVETLDRDVALILQEDLSPAARSAALASFAREALGEAAAANAQALGRVPRHTTFVDGREGADEAQVKADGVIVYEFALLEDVVAWIADQLRTHSPFKTGRYKKSHVVFVDGAEVDQSAPLPATFSEITFVPSVPYARRIERGGSKQAPDGVYQVVAELAKRRFGNVAKITFDYRQFAGLEESEAERAARPHKPRDMRQPAIVITLR